MYKRALVPLDGSPVAESIIPLLLQVAKPFDMSVILLRVLEPIPPVMVDAGPPVIVDDVPARVRDAEEYLAPLAAMPTMSEIQTSSATEERRELWA